jgi:hypothetical protein
MPANIAYMLMERRIPVWTARQQRRYRNFKLKAKKWAFVHRSALIVGLCWASFASAQYIVSKGVNKEVPSQSPQQAQLSSTSHPSPVAQSPPGKSNETSFEATPESPIDPQVNLRLSYEVTLTATQTVSELK